MKKLKLWIRTKLILLLFGSQIKEVSKELLSNDNNEVFIYVKRLLIMDQFKMENKPDFLLGYYHLNHKINLMLQEALNKSKK